MIINISVQIVIHKKSNNNQIKNKKIRKSTYIWTDTFIITDF